MNFSEKKIFSIKKKKKLKIKKKIRSYLKKKQDLSSKHININ